MKQKPQQHEPLYICEQIWIPCSQGLRYNTETRALKPLEFRSFDVGMDHFFPFLTLFTLSDYNLEKVLYNFHISSWTSASGIF